LAEISRVTCTIDWTRDGKQQGVLHVPYSRDRSAYGRIAIPITSITNGAGPTILLTGGNHGDEYEGPVALAKLAQELTPDRVAGRVLIIPALNWPAFQAARRLSPIDDGNLNRLFPGDREGTITQIIAHYVEHVLLAEADYVVDLHSGGLSLNYLPLLLLPDFEDAAKQAAVTEAARIFGAPNAMVLNFLNEDRTLFAAADRQGTVWLGTELGGGASVNPWGLRVAEEGLRRWLRHIGALTDGGPTEPETPSRFLTPSGASDYLLSPANGVFEPLYGLGDVVKGGQLAGHVHRIDQQGLASVPVHWAGDGLVLGMRTLAQVEAGDGLAHLGTPVD